MNVFFAELNLLPIRIIGVLLNVVVVVPEIMLNVMRRSSRQHANPIQVAA